MFGGLFSPTQAGTAGVFGTLVIGLVRRGMTFKKIWDATKDALRVSCMIMFMIAGSIVFGHFLSLSTLSFTIIDWANHLPVSSYMIMLMIICFILLALV